MTSTSRPRVRFAPSPTGHLHIGGVRTALFNWLHARAMGGTFVLRIEDTDRARSTDESTQNLLDTLRWLGLDWDEGPEAGGAHGPYFQTERTEIYAKYAEQLVTEGKAYRCYATREELDALRNALPPKERDRFVYPHIWRDKTPEDWIEGAPYVIRFKAPLTGETSYEDKVFGRITTPNDTLQDFVIMRSDGLPLYNFGAVVDDMLMEIDLVARGADHIANTVPQILLYKALGAKVPDFAHLPLILAPDRRKLSKRDGERLGIPVSVSQFRERGFAPLGVLDYLIRFGWSHGDQELFTLEELVEKFRIEDVTSSDGVFDFKKCTAINQKIIQDDAYLTLPEYLDHLAPFLAERGLKADPETLEAAVALARTRAATFVECADALDYLLGDDFATDPQAEAVLLKPGAADMLRGAARALAALPAFTTEAIHGALDGYVTDNALKWKHFGPTIRIALSGRKATPGLPEMIEVLGPARVQARLEAAAKRADAAEG
jgi:glutamyl-tRNA synthetase